MKPLILPLPLALQALIDTGYWPTTEADVLSQNAKPLVSSRRIKTFAPEENDIVFYRPPFYSVSECISFGEQFWDWPMSAAHEIDPDLTLLIGDFGLGSDAPFALDYSQNFDSPRLIRLQWGKPTKDGSNHTIFNNHWVEMAPDFESFCEMIFR